MKTKDPNKQTEKNCIICDKTFVSYKCRNKIYCSHNCRAKKIPWNKGLKGVQKVSEETRVKLSKAKMGNKNSAGSKHYRWKGGVSVERIKDGYYVRLRRSRKNNCKGSHTKKEWEELKKLFNYVCLCCKRTEPDIKLSRDHIIPIKYGGDDYISNIQPLCKSCNSIKATKVICYLPLRQH